MVRLLFAHVTRQVAFIHLMERLSNGYRNGVGEDIQRCWQEFCGGGLGAGAIPCYSGRHPCKVKGNGNQTSKRSQSHLAGDGGPNSELNRRCLQQFRRITLRCLPSWKKGWFWKTKSLEVLPPQLLLRTKVLPSQVWVAVFPLPSQNQSVPF